MGKKSIQLYDKKTCGTCKKAKEYMDSCHIGYDVIDITKTPPPRELLEKYIDENNLKKYLNSRSTIYREKGYSTKLPTKAGAIKIMLEHPDLIKRPVIVKGDKVYFGFDSAEIDTLK